MRRLTAAGKRLGAAARPRWHGRSHDVFARATSRWSTATSHASFHLGAPYAIYEHHRLLRTQNLDGLDVLCQFDLPVHEIRRRIEQRERGAFLATLFDFELMKRVGDVAFALCNGRAVDVGSGVRLKLRPTAGYGVMPNLRQLARRRGIEPSSYRREELMFLCTSGGARQGLRAYLNRDEIRDLLLGRCRSGLAASCMVRAQVLRARRTLLPACDFDRGLPVASATRHTACKIGDLRS
jgi:hypothetical protein